jgi:hypothetical protein
MFEDVVSLWRHEKKKQEGMNVNGTHVKQDHAARNEEDERTYPRLTLIVYGAIWLEMHELGVLLV